MFSGLKEEKKGGKKDGDQMRITKEKLVEIIKEELENLEEFRTGETGNPRRPGLRRFFSKEKGRASADPDYDPKVAMDDRAGEVDAMDSTTGLSKGGKKVYNAAVADASADASKMDKATSQKDFERVMTWANDNVVATEKNIADAVIDALETGEGRMTATIQEPLLADDDFIKELAKKITQYRHSNTSGE